jgi:Phage integrase family
MLAGRPAAYNRAVMAKRSYGSGRLFVYEDKTGRESWYGSWRAGTRRVQRKIGPKRSQGSTSGLTRVQAERELRKRIDHDLVLATAERKTLADAGALYIGHLEHFTRGKFDSPKSHEGRSVPMADRLARELELHSQRSAYRTDDDLVFCHPHTGNVLDPSKMRKRFREAITRAGVREITFHELRHTFGTQMAAAGAPLRAIQEWMGHADAKTTEIYRHYAPDPTHGAQLVERAFSTPQPSVPDKSPTREQAR